MGFQNVACWPQNRGCPCVNGVFLLENVWRFAGNEVTIRAATEGGGGGKRGSTTSLCFLLLITQCWALDIFVYHRCFAATIELMNGTFIGVKDCFRGDNCTSSTACANITIQVAQGGPGISFRRCEASCCTPNSCNQYLPSSWPPSPTVPATSSMSITQTPATKDKDEDSTAASISVKAVYYLPICLLVVIQIMS